MKYIATFSGPKASGIAYVEADDAVTATLRAIGSIRKDRWGQDILITELGIREATPEEAAGAWHKERLEIKKK